MIHDETRSAKRLRLRKFLLVAPLLILPLLVLLFWAAGWVGDGNNGGPQALPSQGMNLNLPAAAPAKDSNWNKLRYYEQAEKDSQQLRMQLRNDPFYSRFIAERGPQDLAEPLSESAFAEGLYPQPGVPTGEKQVDPYPDEAEVYDRLTQIKQALAAQPPALPAPSQAVAPSVNPDVDQLEGMMQTVAHAPEDPELGKLDQMLDKIIAIQHPENVRQEVSSTAEMQRGKVFAVQASAEPVRASLLDQETSQVSDSNGFYSVNPALNQKAGQTAIKAVIHETQTIVNGATVKLRLTDNLSINGTRIPSAGFVYGVAHLNGERLRIRITSIRLGSQLFPVQLSVFDLDGLEGVRVPGAISREVMQQSTTSALQGLGWNTVSPSVGLQAASLGVEAAKSFLSKKVKRVRVTVKAGYRVLLRDEKQQRD